MNVYHGLYNEPCDLKLIVFTQKFNFNDDPDDPGLENGIDIIHRVFMQNAMVVV